MLAEGKFLAFDVDLDHSGQIHSTADVQIEFGEDSIRIFSTAARLFGDFLIPGPRSRRSTARNSNRFGARGRRKFLFIAAAAAPPGLLVSWWLLATVYFLPVWLLGFFANRDLNFRAELEIVRRGAAAGRAADGGGHLALRFRRCLIWSRSDSFLRRISRWAGFTCL